MHGETVKFKKGRYVLIARSPS